MTARIAQRLIAVSGALCIVALLSVGSYAQAASSSSKDADKETIEWSVDLDCTETCHTRQVETLTDDATQISASHGAFPCTTCHTDVEGMTTGHAKVKADDTAGPKRLKKSEVGSDGCLTCHQVTDGVVPADAWAAEEAGEKPAEAQEEEASQESSSELAIPAYSSTATADIDYLVDSKGTMVNPHDLPVNKSHATLSCASCHTMHDDTTIEETAVKACIKCHHDNVYECFTCHD